MKMTQDCESRDYEPPPDNDHLFLTDGNGDEGDDAAPDAIRPVAQCVHFAINLVPHPLLFWHNSSCLQFFLFSFYSFIFS